MLASMKYLVPAVALLAFGGVLAYAKGQASRESPDIAWVDSIEEGRKLAVRAHKPVFLVTLWAAGT